MLGWLCFIFLRCTDHIGKSNLGYSDDLSLKPLLMRQWPKHSNLQSCHQSWPSSTSSSNSSLSPESPSYIISIFYKRLPFNFLPPQLFPRIKSHHCINFHVAPSVIIIIHHDHQKHKYYQHVHLHCWGKSIHHVSRQIDLITNTSVIMIIMKTLTIIVLSYFFSIITLNRSQQCI